jgi:heat-inducible transcriptional repressor
VDAHTDLTDRDRRILAALVREYIARGEPVSSLWLAKNGGFGLSSATVRNIFAKLEAAGYVKQPHTSAGRVPTDLGYRSYVDHLLQLRRPARLTLNVEARLREAGTVDDVLENVSQELSRLSHHVGFALAPSPHVAILEQIDFVSLGGTKVLVVLIASGGQLSRKVVDAGEPVDPVELRQAASYLNRAFAGRSLSEIREQVVQQLQQDRILYDRLMARALRLANSTFDDEVATPSVLHIQGASSLLTDSAEYERSMASLRALFTMIEEKHRLVRLLNEYIDGRGLRVVIGAEHQLPDLRSFSLIASTYRDGPRSGTVGVIGPTRMRYSRAIAAVDGMAGALTRMLLRDEN